MRRIPFRAWEINSQRWAYFSLQQLWTTNITPSDYEHWCESTGLFDCYGIEIFDSDICVLCPENSNPLEAIPFVIMWEELLGRWYLGGAETLDQLLDIQVIGNVFEHSELLKPSSFHT